MLISQLSEYLTSNNIQFTATTHPPAFTAQEVAEEIHLSGKEVAKTVVLLLDRTMVMAVISACEMVDLENLKQLSGAQKIKLIPEEKFSERFPNCQPGGMPPFGNLYDMNVYVSSSLAKEELITFNAGSHTETIQILFADYKMLVNPTIGRFTTLH